jgi:rhamnosyltransferase
MTAATGSDPAEPGPRHTGVGAVVVTYFPDPETLAKLIASLLPQVAAVMIVDNTPAKYVAETGATPCGCTVLRFGHNRGVATAHNAGVTWAREQGFDYALLLDQDSLPTADMVARLLAAAAGLLARGTPLAAVGARYVDNRSGRSSCAIRIGSFGVRRVECPSDDSGRVIQTEVLISSGMLLRLAALEEIGPLEDELFVDHVDHEWCLRARDKGYRCFLACDAMLVHHLGTEMVRYWLGRWRHVPQHPPWRHYHMLRNTLMLGRRRYVPLAWAVGELRNLVAVLGVALLLQPQRALRLALILRAIWHGLCGRAVPLPNDRQTRS